MDYEERGSLQTLTAALAGVLLVVESDRRKGRAVSVQAGSSARTKVLSPSSVYPQSWAWQGFTQNSLKGGEGGTEGHGGTEMVSFYKISLPKPFCVFISKEASPFCVHTIPPSLRFQGRCVSLPVQGQPFQLCA